MADEIHAYRCSCLAKLPDVIDRFNGSGPRPAAVTVGGLVIHFQAPTDVIQRHERAHVEQAAAFCPRWLGWAPLRVRAWMGAPDFWLEYLKEHRANGYQGNRFENEARAAEIVDWGRPLSAEPDTVPFVKETD